MIETPQANLVAGMRWLLSAYTLRLNHRHKLRGHVFSGRYKAILVDGSGNGYLRTVCDYVHLNPVRAKLIAREDRLLAYPWSSLGWYLAAREHRPDWVRVDRLLGEHGLDDTAANRREFERRIEARRLAEDDPETLRALRQGWCLGGEDFRQEMLERMDGRLGEHHAGELRQESAEAKAERIVQEELKRLGWKEQDLPVRRKSDPEKLAMAARLRTETILSIPRIAVRLHLGSAKSAKAKLASWMKVHTRQSAQPPAETGKIDRKL